MNTFHIFLTVWVTFVFEDPHVMPLSSCEFRENWCSDSCTLLENVNEILPCFIHFSSDLDTFDAEDIYKNTSNCCEFSANLLGEWHTLRTSVNLFLCVPCMLLPNLGEIWYNRSAHNAIEHLFFMKISTEKMILFSWV
jgi:hypothetical protein